MEGLGVEVLAIEPPVTVANILLEEARRVSGFLSGDGKGRGPGDGGEGGSVEWVAPHRYLIPLVVLRPGKGVVLEEALEVLERVRGKDLEVGLRAFEVEGEAGDFRVFARLWTVEPGEFEALRGEVVARVEGLGIDCEVVLDPVLTIGMASDGEKEGLFEGLRRRLEVREGPLARWLLTGLVFARGKVRQPFGVVEGERIRRFSFRRQG